MTTEEIMAKIQMAYDMGRGAREDNDKSNRQELMNFLKTCDDTNDNETTRSNISRSILYSVSIIATQ
jgi:hypothetical protein